MFFSGGFRCFNCCRSWLTRKWMLLSTELTYPTKREKEKIIDPKVPNGKEICDRSQQSVEYNILGCPPLPVIVEMKVYRDSLLKI